MFIKNKSHYKYKTEINKLLDRQKGRQVGRWIEWIVF